MLKRNAVAARRLLDAAKTTAAVFITTIGLLADAQTLSDDVLEAQAVVVVIDRGMTDPPVLVPGQSGQAEAHGSPDGPQPVWRDEAGAEYTENQVLEMRERIVEQLGGESNLERIEKDPPDIATQSLLHDLHGVESILEQMNDDGLFAEPEFDPSE